MEDKGFNKSGLIIEYAEFLFTLEVLVFQATDTKPEVTLRYKHNIRVAFFSAENSKMQSGTSSANHITFQLMLNTKEATYVSVTERLSRLLGGVNPNTITLRYVPSGLAM